MTMEQLLTVATLVSQHGFQNSSAEFVARMVRMGG